MTNNPDKLLLIAKTLAQTIVENGGEIYRAEESVRRIQSINPDIAVDAFALPTGVFITVTPPDGKTLTSICRFKNFRIDLDALDRTNDIARKLSVNEITIEDALLELKQINNPNPHSTTKTSLMAAFAAACMSVLFGGGILDFIFSAVCAFLSRLLIGLFEGEDMYKFITSLIGGAACAFVGAVFSTIFKTSSLETIIASSIFTLLPGTLLVNAIRDSVHGDLISGVAKLGDVFVIVLALAAGTGSIIWLYSLLGGVL